MTGKRFTSQRTDDYNYSDILDNGKWIGICHVDCEDDFVDKLNELHEDLKHELTVSKALRDVVRELEKENEELKFERDRYKRLSEIRQENINNRILTIKEFIDNCSDKKVKKTLEQLFHSEVNEYDLSKKIRKLEKENEQLKFENKKLNERIGILEGSLIDKGFDIND